jgi:membrane-bound metal-dependent hydrolase YbcI (DUF457 family)
MKGITHFTIGVAAASCWPTAINAAASGNPLYFILGGIFGLLPDTIDFKFYRFFYRHNAEVIPDPINPDPQLIADTVAATIDKAASSRKPFRIKLNTIRMDNDLWQRYTIKFVPAENMVEVSFGEQVDTGGNFAQPAPIPKPKASAKFEAPIKLDYLTTTYIDIFDGPTFQMTPDKSGKVIPQFIPWHREWSHSFVVGIVLAILPGLLWGWKAAAVAAIAYASHIICDQLGYLGSNLFWPISHHRTPGLKRQHSTSSFPNFYAIWLAIMLTLWNISYTVKIERTELLSLIAWCAALPILVHLISRRKIET